MEDYFAQINITNRALKYLTELLLHADDIWDIYRESFSKEKADEIIAVSFAISVIIEHAVKLEKEYHKKYLTEKLLNP